MTRLLSLTAALFTAVLFVGAATSAQAQPAPGFYRAVPAATPAKPQVITRDVMWKWHDGAYLAAKSGNRDAVVCALVARQAGALTSFSAGGRAFDAAALAKCNTRAA